MVRGRLGMGASGGRTTSVSPRRRSTQSRWIFGQGPVSNWNKGKRQLAHNRANDAWEFRPVIRRLSLKREQSKGHSLHSCEGECGGCMRSVQSPALERTWAGKPQHDCVPRLRLCGPLPRRPGGKVKLHLNVGREFSSSYIIPGSFFLHICDVFILHPPSYG
jgi:hypothetical protein